MNTKQELIKFKVVQLQQLLLSIESGDFDITQQRASATGQSTGVATFRGDGEFLMKIRRFVPDFISQTGNTQVTLQLKNYPNMIHKLVLLLGPFTYYIINYKSRYTCKS